MIPKVIHYCWFGGKPMPKSVLKCINSWKKFCPDFAIIQHNESNYDVTKNRYMKEAYEAGKWAFVSDYARLDILYNEGGIYFDTDVELIKPIDSFLDYKGFMGFENNKQVGSGLGTGAEIHSPIIKMLLDDYENIPFNTEDGFDLKPCPQRNMPTLVKNIGLNPDGTYQEIDGFRFYPRDVLSPKDSMSGRMRYKTKNTVAIHHFDATWQTDEFLFEKKVNYIFGGRIGTKLSKFLKPLWRRMTKNRGTD